MKILMAMLGMVLLTLLSPAAHAAQDDNNCTARAPALKAPGHYEWSWEGADKLAVAIPATVHYVRTGSPRIVITGPDAALAHIRVGQGCIRADDDYSFGRGFSMGGRDAPQLNVIVSGITLDDFALNGSTRLELGHLDQAQLRVAINGSGSVQGDGHVNHLEMAIFGSGRIELGNVTANRADIRIAGSGDAVVTPKDEANVTISGSGAVRLTTNPTNLHRSVTGSGKIMVGG